MSNIILLLLCLVVGMVLRGVKTLPENAATVLNGFIVNVSLPALTLLHTVEIQFSIHELLPILSAWLVFGGAFLFFTATKKITRFDKSTLGALITVAGISSISFVGFPIFELLYGAEGLRLGILMSQSGTFLVCSTVGIVLVSIYSNTSDKLDWKLILRDVLIFPPFASFVLALMLKFLGYQHPSVLKEVLAKIGGTLNVLALISIGLQMNFSLKTNSLKPLLWGLVYKMLLAPLLVFVIFACFVPIKNTAFQISVIGSALGSMNTIGIIAMRKGLNPTLIVQMIGISIPLSFVFVPIVYFILQNI